MRVFTGSLNNVPLFSAWPRALPLSASCSLKKLQFWSWDPTTTAAVNMITQFISSPNGPTNNHAGGDAGMYRLIAEALTRVTDWDPKAIHIGAVPNDWFGWAQNTERAIDHASSMAAILGPSAIIGGQQQFGNLNLRAGLYGNRNLSQAQVDLIEQIYVIVVGQSGISTAVLQDRAATIALMVAGAESSYTNLPGGDGSSVGLFQQIDAWGTAEQRNNVEWTTKAFIKGANGNPGLLDKDWQTGPLSHVCQDVQQSSAGRASSGEANYGPWEATAREIVVTLRGQINLNLQSGSGNATGTNPTNNGIPTGNSRFHQTGDQFARVGYDLINSHEPGHIRYQYAPPGFDPRSDDPRVLDCSALVSWIYYHTTGKIIPPQSGAQYGLCTLLPPLNIAVNIRGALLFNGAGGNEHVALSLGDNRNVAARIDTVPLAQQVEVQQDSYNNAGVTLAGLLPDIDYSGAATNEEARAWLQRNLHKTCTISSPTDFDQTPDPNVTGGSELGTGSDITNPFAQLISAFSVSTQPSGNIFGGSRELMNNQPFLPWLQTLTNSTMRAFSSAPNGDFIAWFPDYFNVWKTAAIMDIKLIELQDFTVEWSDQQIVTHEFVLGSVNPILDGSSGGIVEGGTQDYTTLYAMLATEGIATMDFPQIFKTIYGKPVSWRFVHNYLRRFGARPNVESMPNIHRGPQEFYMALWMFMKHWAEQFNATVPMTFMPELWPGMILRIKEFGFQAYITEVTHRGSYGEGGKFTTEAKIIAPAPMNNDPKGVFAQVLNLGSHPLTDATNAAISVLEGFL